MRRDVSRTMHRLVASAFILILTAALHVAAQDRRWSIPADGANRSEQPERTIRAIIRAGRLEDLQWPDLSRYRTDLESFYHHLGYAPAWLRAGLATEQASQLIDIFQNAESEGLSPGDYDSSRWPERLDRLQSQHSLSDEVHFDIALTVCAMRYSSDLSIGKVNPQDFKFAIDQSINDKLDLPSFVERHLANGNNLNIELAALESRLPGYQELKHVLATYTVLAKKDDGERLPIPIPPGYPGPPYPGFARLTQMLRLLGDLPDNYSASVTKAQNFDPTVEEAVRRFQERHSLVPTGYLDEATIEQLNVPLESRVEQIRLALERYRWLHHYHSQEAVVVNIPAFHLYVLDEQGKIKLNMSVDVGEDFESTRTPVMSDHIEYVIFRPYWDVPADIQKNEVVPLIAVTRDLSDFDFEALSPAGQVVADAKVTNALLEEIRTGAVHIRQKPGSMNPMGLVKFAFPNRYSVYLHDTPWRELRFMVPQRLVSHGCIHVEKPAELAAWLLRDQPRWSLDAVSNAMVNGRDNLRVDLTKPLPILIFYTTASTLQHGHVHFYKDVYRYDEELRQTLAMRHAPGK